MANEEAYLKAILSLLARQAFPPDDLRKLVVPRGDGAKQIAAFNACNGKRNQTEVAQVSKMDKANLNKTLARWEEQGIIIRIEDENGTFPLHIYPLPK